MKHFTFPLITLSVLLLTACGNNNEPAPPTKNEAAMINENNEKKPESQQVAKKGSWADLLKAYSGDSVCTFNSEDNDDFKANGTMWIEAATQKMYQESQVAIESGTQNMNMIFDNGTQYMWGDALEKGVKIGELKFDESIFENIQVEDDNSPEDMTIDFDCQPWNVDSSKFTVPSDIEFVDVTESMNQVMKFSENLTNGGEPGAMNIDCSICDLAPEGDQAGCRAALSC